MPGKPQLDENLRERLIARYRENTSMVAFLVWYDKEDEQIDFLPYRWKAKAYEARQYMIEDNEEYIYDDFLIVDIVDLKQL